MTDHIYPQAKAVQELINAATHLVIIQADNPDADSLASSLALEHLLGDRGKRLTLYCGTDMPTYLRYLEGWDRVVSELPKQFDASILVDASTLTLLERLQTNNQIGWIAVKPCLLLDHHATVGNPVDFATTSLLDEQASSTGELIYHLAKQLSWPLNQTVGSYLMTAILSDTQGLANDLASSTTYQVMADLIDRGVSRPSLEEQRREFGKMSTEIFKYKATLIERTEFSDHGRIAHVTIPQIEINTYSPSYNPAPLVQNDMLSVSGVAVAIVFKHYDDGRTTGAIRANTGFPVADKLAEKLKGGGHPYASGFKVMTGRPFNEIKSECLALASELLNTLDKEPRHETVQHPQPTT